MASEQRQAGSQEFDPKVLGGSIKRKIVNPDLAEERAKCNFDKEQAFLLFYDEETRFEFDFVFRLIKKYPHAATNPKFYEMSRREKMVEWWDRLKLVMQDPELK